jgi:WD40 repeat protein
MTHDRMVTSIVFSPDGRYVVSGSLDGTARIWEAASGEEIVRMTAEEEVSSVLISADGRYVVSGGCDRTGLTIGSTCGPEEGTVRVWEVETGKEVARMTYANAVLSVAISPDSSHVVSASWDGTARVWEAVTGKEVARMTYDGSVTAVAFSPDGNFVVSGACEDFTEVSCTEGTVRIWEASTGREVTRMAQAKGTSAVAFSPDGKYVLSAECDKVVHKRAGICIQGTVHIWEAGTGKEVARMVHDDYVSAAAFSPDGRYVVSGSSDGTVRVWLYRPEDLIADACSRLQRNLTRAEWNQYIGGVLTYQAVCDHLPLDPEATPTP